MFLLNSFKFDIEMQRVIDDVQYPRGWFLDAGNREAVGIIEVPDPVYPDDNLFTTFENPDGSLTATPRSPEEIAERAASALADFQADIVRKVQTRLDAFAQTRGYDNILSASSYASSGVPRFAQEARDCVAARDAMWDALYALVDDVAQGRRPPLSDADTILALLPPLTWSLS